MQLERIFSSKAFQQPADGEPIRAVITESADAAVISWIVKPGQTISAHLHPAGQDTWVVLLGSGLYRVNAAGNTRRISAGDVVVAHRGEVHGVLNDGSEPLEFVSVVSPTIAGYEPIKA
jgi:quercetin dioxygenase-like cupin family protein